MLPRTKTLVGRALSSDKAQWARKALVAVVAATLMLSLVYVALRVRVIQGMQRDLAENRVVHNQLQAEHNAQMAEIKARLDALERVLFGDVLAELSKIPAVGPSRIELWQQNRDKELRDRILSAERRLGRAESVIEQLRDELR